MTPVLKYRLVNERKPVKLIYPAGEYHGNEEMHIRGLGKVEKLSECYAFKEAKQIFFIHSSDI